MFTDSDYDTDSSLSPGSSPVLSTQELPTPMIWGCDPAFGIVHIHGCSKCRHYMSHLVVASQTPEDPTFREAIKERDSRVTLRFLEGIREGRRLQAQHDHARMTRYRAERDTALAMNHRYEDEVHHLRSELAEMRDALMALQLAYDDQVAVSSFGTASINEQYNAFHPLDLQDALPQTADVSGSGGAEAFLNDTPAEDPVTPPTALESGFCGGHVHHSADFENATLSDWDSTDDSSSYNSSSTSGTSTDSLVILSEGESLEQELTLDQVKDLMAAAHDPNQPEILAQVRSLCAKAHETRRGHRTAVQKYLLEAWRNPRGTTVTRVPPLTSVPEIFVDASGKGIGFVMNNRWLAWKLKAGWQAEGRDIRWAEMVAAELGLRAMIAAGIRSTHLRLRSDDGSVITALTTHQVRSPTIQPILRGILSLCESYEIHLMPVWVSTKDNRADGPSRGVYSSKALCFDSVPTIPEHLVPYVCMAD